MIAKIVLSYIIAMPIILSAQSGQIKYRIKIPNNSATNFINDIPGYLYFNNNYSLFVYDRIKDQEPKDSIETHFSYRGIRTPKRYRDDYGQMFCMDKRKNLLYFRVFVNKTAYISQESIPKIEWQLHHDTKIILDKLCKKATTTFRGRTYTVWYTSAVPVSVGPWKLQGLPGAILEIESEDKEITMTAQSITILSHDEQNIQNYFSIFQEPIPGEYVTFQEFKESPEKERRKLDNIFQTIIMPKVEELSKENNKPTPILKPIPPNIFMIELSYE